MNTKEPFVITISREVGSGGHTVGSMLAKKLDVRFCDKQLLESLEKQFDLSAGEIEKLKGKKKNWLTDFAAHVVPMPFKAEVEILRGFAQMGSCVIAGRSGFFVFKDHPNKLNVFITASLPHRLNRVMNKQSVSEEKALTIIKELDRARENYIQRFAGVSRYDVRNYDLVLSADGHSEEELADIILSYI